MNVNKFLRYLLGQQLLSFNVVPEEGGGVETEESVDGMYDGGTEETVGEVIEGQDFSGEKKELDATEDASSDQQDAVEGEEGVELEGQQEKPAAQAQVLKLDAETIAALRAGAQPTQQQQQQRQEPSRMSPEEFQKTFNPVVVDENVLKGLGFEAATPEQVQGFQTFANSIVKNAVSIARVIIAQKEHEFQQAMAPLGAHYQANQEQQVKSEFYGSFKGLEKYDKIVKMAAREVTPHRADGSEKTKDEIYKEVADRTKATLASLGLKLDSVAAANPSAGGSKTVPQPNRFAPSGRSGGDGVGTGKTNNPDADIY